MLVSSHSSYHCPFVLFTIKKSECHSSRPGLWALSPQSCMKVRHDEVWWGGVRKWKLNSTSVCFAGLGWSTGSSRRVLPLPSPGDLPNPGIESESPTWQADSLLFETPGKPLPIEGTKRQSVSEQRSSWPSEDAGTALTILLPQSWHAGRLRQSWLPVRSSSGSEPAGKSTIQWKSASKMASNDSGLLTSCCLFPNRGRQFNRRYCRNDPV